MSTDQHLSQPLFLETAVPPPPRRLTLSIGQKLMVMIGLLITAVISVLAMSWTSSQISTMTERMRRKAATYGALVAHQTSSAVAFSDRATAQEVLSSLDMDPDVAAIVLYGANHEILYSYGEPSAWVARVGDLDARVEHTVGRISSITPVRSLEGPRGTLIIQLSTGALDAARTRVRTLALVSGLAACAFGILVAWLIARRIARRMRALADAATAVAGGDLSGEAIADASDDEIGMAVRAFNGMVSQLRHLIARVRHQAKREKVRLEGLVVARTVQLDRRNAEMRLIFDHVDQGFLTVDMNGVIASEHSAAVERWLGRVPEGALFSDYVRSFAPAEADWFEMAWTTLSDGTLPIEIALAQLPSLLEVAGRPLRLSFKVLADERGERRVLVMISDETAKRERDRAERDERETTAMISRILADRAGFAAFYTETEFQVRTIETGLPGSTLARAIHTLKGTCALEGLASLAELCHELESAIAEGDEVGARSRCRAIAARWKLLAAKLAPLLAVSTGEIVLSSEDLRRIESAIGRGDSREQLADLVATWRNDRVEARLSRFADQVRILAGELCKDPIDVRVEVDQDLRLPLDGWSGFWATFVHAVRNAVDHGLETSSERTLAGKPMVAEVVLRGYQRHGQITIELEDHGRGIDWDRVASAARARGLPASTPEDLQNALFHDGLSTRTNATELSGRGVGLGALRDACLLMGGRLVVSSTRNVGTKLTATWPESAVRPRTFCHAG